MHLVPKKKLALLLTWLLLLGFVLLPILPVTLPFSGQVFIRGLYKMLCHQIEDRCFHWQGIAFAVCHRCMGLYLGWWLGMNVYPLIQKQASFFENHSRLVLFVTVSPMLVDWLLGVLQLGGSPWQGQFGTGLVAGLGMSYFVTKGIYSLFFEILEINPRLLFIKPNKDHATK